VRVALYRRLTVVTKANKSLENATKCEYIGMTVKRWIKLKRDSVWIMRVLLVDTVPGQNQDNMSQNIGSLGRERKVIYMKQNSTIGHRMA